MALNHFSAVSHLGVLVALANHDLTFNQMYVGSIPTAPTQFGTIHLLTLRVS